MSRLIDRELIAADAATAATYQAEIHALLGDLRALAPDLELLTDSRQYGGGFSTPESRAAVDRMTIVERTERRAQPVRRDDTGQQIVGLKWLNRTTIAAGTGEIQAPGNFRGIAAAAEVPIALTEHVQRIRRIILASGYPDPEPELLDLAKVAAARDAGDTDLDQHYTTERLTHRLARLVAAAPSASLLAPIQRDLDQLVDQVFALVDGPDRSHRPDPCPHCGHESLIRYEATRRRPEPVTRCERDPRWKSKHYRPCVCTAAICQCKSDPVGFRHEWFDNPKDRTQTSVWDLIDRIKRIKENAVLETLAQDAAQRVRELHARLVVHPWAADCPGEHLEPDEAEAADRGVEQQLVIHQHVETDLGDVCVTCDPAVIACTHCTQIDAADYIPWPCATIRALDATD